MTDKPIARAIDGTIYIPEKGWVPGQSAKLSARPDHMEIACPICDNHITVSIVWERETGEFGSILSEYPTMNPDPATIDRHDYCHCDFGKTLAGAMAEYLNDEERIDELLFPSSRVDPPDSPLRDE